jgi:hypothetical protein
MAQHGLERGDGQHAARRLLLVRAALRRRGRLRRPGRLQLRLRGHELLERRRLRLRARAPVGALTSGDAARSRGRATQRASKAERKLIWGGQPGQLCSWSLG